MQTNPYFFNRKYIVSTETCTFQHKLKKEFLIEKHVIIGLFVYQINYLSDLVKFKGIKGLKSPNRVSDMHAFL